MTLSASDIKFRKALTQTDTTLNGGRKGAVEVVSAVRHNLFPRVTKAERTAGVTRYRKEFWCNENADDDVAYGAMLWLEHRSNGGDRFSIALGTQTDRQSDMLALSPIWKSTGQLAAVLNGGETSVQITMEAADAEFEPGSKLHISDKFLAGQTIAAGVVAGDSVELVTGTWEKIGATSSIEYPYGLYIGGNMVMTEQGSTNEEWLTIEEGLHTDEVLGTGDGSDTTPSLFGLTGPVCALTGYLPVITATCGSATRTVNVSATGACSGYCVAGQLNMTTGVWTTPLEFTSAPDNSTDITCTYYERPYSYAGSVATVQLSDQVANAFATANTFVGCCIDVSEVKPTVSNWVESSSAGTYDESTYPLIMFNDGTEQDTWTLSFSSSTIFSVSGAAIGSLGAGSVGSDFSPVNPATGQPYFTISAAGWAGLWAVGEIVVFRTDPAAIPIWIRQIVPAVCAAEPNNLVTLGFYTE